MRHPGVNLGTHHSEAHDRAESQVFGFRVFLMSDMIIFESMLATSITMANPVGLAGGPGPKDAFDLTSVFAQTLILLTRSLIYGNASLALQHELGRGRGRIALWLGMTLALGMSFLMLEAQDFTDMISSGAVPSRSSYLSAFSGLVPLLGLHVTAECIRIVVMLVQIGTPGLIPDVQTRLMRLGLFWRFLDLVRVGIFTIAYLAGLGI